MMATAGLTYGAIGAGGSRVVGVIVSRGDGWPHNTGRGDSFPRNAILIVPPHRLSPGWSFLRVLASSDELADGCSTMPTATSVGSWPLEKCSIRRRTSVIHL